ncbi:MAG: Rhamnulokinase [Bacteroidetes bacterium ADurb.Bin123]|nr:MAG: Rhamnulokinase [Bacteroidetes bacterium ADurb.Bin123]
MNVHHFLAFDLGASSGRAMLGSLEGDKLTLTEVHRFNNQMLLLHGHYFWNIFSLFCELKTGLTKCVRELNIQPESIGIDTWGVDYCLVTADGHIAGLPFAYRDGRTDNSMERFFSILSKKETYELSGIQFMQFNTLFQLFSAYQSRLETLKIADSMLFTPDALNFLFTGIRKNEYTIASTSQMLKPGKAEWEYRLFDVAGIPHDLAEEIILPGNILGPLLPEVCSETGSDPIPCIAVASHDTASAVASVPAEEGNWAYISSGTWSLMGIESPVPLVTEEMLALNFTNEGGIDGTTRFLKNIMGLWLIQECKRKWDAGTTLSWSDIVEMSKTAPPFISLVDPDDHTFLNPPDMPEAIREFCRKTEQPVPATMAAISRCIYDSLALKYKYTLDQIEKAIKKPVEKIHIIGGGANNRFLCQLTANATGLPVIAGPVEATAIGNILMQARGLGYIDSLREMRQIVSSSFANIQYLPSGVRDWQETYLRFKLIVQSIKP